MPSPTVLYVSTFAKLRMPPFAIAALRLLASSALPACYG